MKEGAYDFIQKPVDLEHLNLLVERASQQQELLRENLLLREEYAERYGFPRIVGEHKSMQEARTRSSAWPPPIQQFCCWDKAEPERNYLRGRFIIFLRDGSRPLSR